MRHLFYFLLVIGILSCKEKTSAPTANEISISAENFEKNLQSNLIDAVQGAIYLLPEGKFDLKGSISLQDIPNITIKGKGKGKTILSFKNQISGAEGMLIKNVKDLTLEGFTVADSKGDAIKVQGCTHVIMRDLETTWTGGKLPTNGAYGLYPVSCTGVLMENCEASYAMDAGIYVGQSTNVIVRKNYAHNNVAGIEIENTICGEVYDNKATQNAGGMLIFDMPDLPQANGDKIKFYNNIIEDNNGENYAPKGMVVSTIPSGSGMIIMAHRNIEMYNNTIKNNKSLGIAINSWLLTGVPFKSKDYDPYCKNIYIHNNQISGTSGPIDQKSDFGKLISGVLQGKPSDILVDGIFSPETIDAQGKISGICITDNGNVSFACLNMFKGQKPEQIVKNITTEISQFNCKIDAFDTSCHNAWLPSDNNKK
jgi:parallel beta-helix repeat protein